MTKQEEIREGMKYWVAKGGGYDVIVQNLIQYLHSENVVIRVERELSEQVSGEIDEVCERYALRPNYANQRIGEILDKAGYVRVEPLIKEE